MTLAGRMGIASAAVAMLVGAAFAALLLAVSAQRNATEREARSRDVTTATLRLEKLVVDLETGIRGLTLTGNRRFLEPYTAARREIPGRAAALERLVAEDAEQRERALQLARLIRRYVKDYAAPLVAIVSETPQIAGSTIVVDQGKRRTDEIRSLFRDFLDVENRLTQEAAATAGSRTDRAVVVGWAGLVVSSALVVLFGIVLARSIGQPLRGVSDGARRFAAGDLAHRLPTGGPGEVGDLRRSFNVMASRLQAGREELQEQNELLRESERMKTELVSIVSHELRTPLASVLGFTSLLLKRDLDPATRRHYLGIVDTQGRRLAALLEDFLDVQRIEHEGVDLAAEPVDVASLLREQTQLYAGESPTHRVVLSVPEGPLQVSGDANRLAQVFGNLLSNAIKYSPEGGLVNVIAQAKNGGVRLSVADEGIGIPKDQQSRIFLKFFRGDAGATGITGTGLGLAVSREIVEAHGGLIGFESAQGQGSTFWVELPSAGFGNDTKKEDT